MVFKIMENTVFTNARLIARDRVVSGELLISDGWIAGINDSGQNSFNGAVGSIDCEGDFLAPGMIELHTDNLERHLRPRPNVVQPEIDAVLAHDGELASFGSSLAARYRGVDETAPSLRRSRRHFPGHDR